MKILNTLVFAALSFAGAAQSAEIVPTPTLACTKDINPWGHAGRCLCPHKTRYDERLGSCVIGAYDAIRVSGAIQTGLVAIGGETSGIGLLTFAEPTQSYELILKQEDQKKLAQLQGVPFEVEGDFIVLPGVEVGPRPAIIVRTLNWLD